MKVDFSPAGPGGEGTKRLSKRLIERYMKHRLEVRPLDDASDTVRIGAIAAAAFFGLFLVFALFAPVSGAAVAQGEVATSGDKLVIQPLGTGIVSEVLVREGQQVRPGQPLVRLNGVRSGAQLKQAQARRDALRATEARLIAERDGLDRLIFPPDLASRSADPTAFEAMRAQIGLFERRRSVLQSDRALVDTRLVAAEAQRTASATQLALVKDELAGIEELYNKGFARKSTLRALQRSAAQLQADSLTGGVSVEQAQIEARRVRHNQIMSIVTELARVQEQLAQVNPQLDVSRYEADRDVLRAPAAGRVAGLAQLGPGMVVSGGRVLMQIVPQSRTLIIEARVKPADIDDVRVGMIAKVHFSTVNPRGQSAFDGRVVTLSPAAITGESANAQPYYRAQIVLNGPAAAARAGVSLQPGIPVSVNIITKRRTLWDYLTAPLGDAMSRSMREE